jgi:hypothetical protein
MTGKKHTPGPWAVDTRYGSCFVTAHDSRGICSAGSYSDTSEDPTKLLAENEANARLIAAAPELLMACQGMIDERDVFGLDYWFSVMEAAIAKATGND